MATTTPKRLAGPAAVSVLATPTTLITVPASHRYVIKQIIVTNQGATPRTFVMSIGDPATAALRIMSDVALGANEVLIFDTAITLEVAETLRAYADSASLVNVTVNGWDYSA
jgi:hypothetical protein